MVARLGWFREGCRRRRRLFRVLGFGYGFRLSSFHRLLLLSSWLLRGRIVVREISHDGTPPRLDRLCLNGCMFCGVIFWGLRRCFGRPVDDGFWRFRKCNWSIAFDRFVLLKMLTGINRLAFHWLAFNRRSCWLRNILAFVQHISKHWPQIFQRTWPSL
ncbi:hypothetical protein BJ742DRAFT_846103, partial [Cladochytrium replicatum]